MRGVNAAAGHGVSTRRRRVLIIRGFEGIFKGRVARGACGVCGGDFRRYKAGDGIRRKIGGYIAVDERSRSRLVAAPRETVMTRSPTDQQRPHNGKVKDDHDKIGEHHPSPLDQGRRSPASRGDRESHVGGRNPSQSRRGPVGGDHSR